MIDVDILNVECEWFSPPFVVFFLTVMNLTVRNVCVDVALS
jgi:hypothetical protein